jgi:UDP-N-acetylmuramoylalanine--D-glutamate ligase
VITAPAFAGKTFGVYGLARSGRAAVAALTASGARTLNWDDGAVARAAFDAELTDLHATDLAALDALIVSPGVPHDAPLFVAAVAAGVPVIGDIELFARARSGLPPHKVVGITGTNGKSTTTALIHHILKAAGRPATMGGNIGLPILAQDPLPEHGVYVLELSSFQLDLTYSLDCEVALLLNITPDHLDRHGTIEVYAAAKERLFAMQSTDHISIIASNDAYSNDIYRRLWMRPHKADHIRRVLAEAGESQALWPALQGPHNAQNARTAVAACAALGLSAAEIAAGLASYPGLPHRMERIAEKSGVLWVNDSKATNPDSSAPALAAYPRTHWIAGGRAKLGTDGAADLAAVMPFLGNVRGAYLIGEAAPLFAPILAPRLPVTVSGNLDRAVAAAAAAAVAGDTVLLSPACASYDQFRDFEDRGNAFRRLVEALPEATL